MKQHHWFWLSVSAILLLASSLRIANLAHNPGWFTDEATHLEVVRHLLNGRIQYLAITDSVLLFSRLPLFELLLAAAVALFGYGMMTLRGLTAVLGILSVLTLILVVRRMTKDVWLALLSGLLLAIMPQAVLYSRFGFSYNLLVPLLLLTLLGMWLYWTESSRRWLAVAALCLGLGLISDLLMLAFIPGFVLLVLWRNWHDGWCLLILAAPFALYTAVSLFTSPAAFWFDLHFVLFRLSPTLPQQMELLQQNVLNLGRMAWLVWGFVGLFWLRPLPLRNLLLFFLLLPLFILGRTASLYNLGFYYMIPFLPLFALGLAGLLRFGGAWILHWMEPRWGTAVSRIILITLFTIPLLLSVRHTWAQVEDGFCSDIEPFLLHGESVMATAVFLQDVIRPEDRVVASPTVGFLLNGQVADFQMVTAVQGIATPHLPASLPPERFAFRPDYRQTRIVIVDNLWDNWTQIHVPGAAEMMADVQNWQIVFQAGDVVVYQNPKTESD